MFDNFHNYLKRFLKKKHVDGGLLNEAIRDAWLYRGRVGTKTQIEKKILTLEINRN